MQTPLSAPFIFADCTTRSSLHVQLSHCLNSPALVKLLPGTGQNDAPLSETAPWTVENGGLLASNKLGRKSIQKELGPLVANLRKLGIRN